MQKYRLRQNLHTIGFYHEHPIQQLKQDYSLKPANRHFLVLHIHDLAGQSLHIHQKYYDLNSPQSEQTLLNHHQPSYNSRKIHLLQDNRSYETIYHLHYPTYIHYQSDLHYLIQKHTIQRGKENFFPGLFYDTLPKNPESHYSRLSSSNLPD